MNLQEFLLSINGYATLVANNGTFLGVVSSNQNDLNSICNPHGQYGSPHAFNSVRNPYSMYGGEHGIYSPYNPYAFHPPVIVYNSRVVLVVTRNTNLISFAYGGRILSGIPIVAPDFLFAVYGCLGSTGTTTSFQGGFIPVNPQPYPMTGTPSYAPAQVQTNKAEAWFLQGNELLNSQRYEEAISAYNQAVAACDKVIQQKPDIPIGWYSKACCYALQGNIELAIKNLKWTIQIDSKYQEVAKNDSNFDEIREDERFQKLIDG